ITELNLLKDKPFFLAVGFYNPHIPFNAPKKYWDLYDPLKISPSSQPKPPQNSFPHLNLHRSGEPKRHYKWDGNTVTEKQGRNLKHGYYAAVSYVDAQIGKVLNEVKRLGLDKNTVIVLWSDHGWHLGDYGVWGKWTNYEIALRSPLIIKTPGMRKAGVSTSGLAAAIDIFPTLADLCDLEKPKHLQGVSLRRAIEDPSAVGKKAIIGSVSGGHTIRTDRYRLIVKKGKIELYDHHNDPQESINIAVKKPEVVARLTSMLDKIRKFKTTP
ncbi:MAG: sulfatase-like hydrolase/transferase, partial [Lentisphaeraceae bacterium]|nr:sulfatase-like hydrolase/transferase [Lentisphaeraceae bacterium]